MTDTSKPNASVLMLLSKCKSGIQMLIVEESYKKWGAIVTKSLLDDKTAQIKATVSESIGQDISKVESHKVIPHKKVEIVLAYTSECVEDKLGKKKKSELLSVKHVPVEDIFKLVDKPKPDMPLRPIFVSMLVESKKDIEAFIKSLK